MANSTDRPRAIWCGWPIPACWPRSSDDYTTYGHELLVGAGKNLRDGEGVNAYRTASHKILDVVIKNATIVDAVTGIVKADIGIRDGRIVGIGKAGNPDVMPDVHPDMIVGHTTAPIGGGPFIVTAGAIESHAHLISPEQSDHALSGGTTTLVGNGSGPVFDVGSGAASTFARFLQAIEFSPSISRCSDGPGQAPKR